MVGKADPVIVVMLDLESEPPVNAQVIVMEGAPSELALESRSMTNINKQNWVKGASVMFFQTENEVCLKSVRLRVHMNHY